MAECEYLTDMERMLVVTLVTEAWARIQGDPAMKSAAQECEGIVRKLSGVDKRASIETLR